MLMKTIPALYNELETGLREKISQMLSCNSIETNILYDHDYLWKDDHAQIPIRAKIIEDIGDRRELTTTEIINRTRNYIYTSHVLEELRSDGDENNLAKILNDVYCYHNGLRKKSVTGLCQLNMRLMRSILSWYGIQSNEIAILTEKLDRDVYGSHALLEVWNDHTLRWELNDPTYDVIYSKINKGCLEPLSASEFFSLDSKNIKFYLGKNYGWRYGSEDTYTVEERIRYCKNYADYSYIVIMRYMSYGSTALVNLDLVDIRKRLSNSGNLNIIEVINSLFSRNGQPPYIIGFYKSASNIQSAITLPSVNANFEFEKYFPDLARKIYKTA